MKRRAFFFVAAAALLAATAHAAAVVSLAPRQRYALLISAQPDRPAAASQVRRIGAMLESDFGYRDVVELYGDQATIDGIRSAVIKLNDAVQPPDYVFVLIDLPVAFAADDVVAVPFGGDRSKPWTVLSPNDFAKWIGNTRAGDVAAIIPVCTGYSKGGFYAFEELRYARSRAGATRIVSICDEKGVIMTSLVEMLAGALASPVAFNLDELVSAAVETYGRAAVNVTHIGENTPFTFARAASKLDPLIATVTSSSANSRTRVQAIQDMVSAVKAEPPERRPAVVSKAEGVLIAATGDANRDVRLAAIWAAGEIGLHAAAGRLESQFLTTTDQDEKKTIITALNKLGDSRALNVIHRGLEDPSPAVRVATLRAGAALRDDAIASKIVALGSSDAAPEVRVAVLQNLTTMAVAGAVKIDIAGKALADPDPAVRRQALATWTELKQPATTPAILAMLQNDPDPDVRQTVAYAIGRSASSGSIDAAAVQELVNVLSSRQPERVRAAAAWSLGRAGASPATERALVAALNRAANPPSVRAAAAESLGLLKSRSGVRALEGAMRSDSPELRRAAVQALGRVGEESSLEVLLEALADPDAEVRGAASQAINEISPKIESLQVLLNNLGDEKSPAIRREAAERLSDFPTPAVGAALVQRLGDRDPSVRAAVVESLSIFNDDSTRRAVREALTSPNPIVVESAVKVAGLQRLSDVAGQVTAIFKNERNPGSLRAEAVRAAINVGADDIVFAAARDRDPLIREAAVDAMREQSSSRGIEELKRLSSDPSPAVREKAIVALRALGALARGD
jgi:HEAT repeat protein